MNRTLCVLTVIFISISLKAQVVHRAYYDKNGGGTTLNDSYYYSEIDANETKKFFTYYTATKTVRSKEVRDSLGVKRTFYHIAGSVKAEFVVDKNGRTESVNVFYPDGKKQAELGCEEPTPGSTAKLRLYILNYWDSLGTQVVTEGNGVCRCVLTPELDEPFVESGRVANKMKEGVWSGLAPENKTFEEHYTDGVLTQGTFHDHDGQVYQYTEVEKRAEPPGGYQSFYRYIGNNLKYPLKARRLGIEGKVFVEFVIQKDGSLTDLNVIKGICEACDAEAIRVIGASKKWSPGVQRGKIVKQRFVLPIGFKLQ